MTNFFPTHKIEAIRVYTFAIGTATEGMPAAGGEGIRATTPREAARRFVEAGDWGDSTSVTVSVAPIVDGEIDRAGATSHEVRL